jgi:hypothetical protein
MSAVASGAVREPKGPLRQLARRLSGLRSYGALIGALLVVVGVVVATLAGAFSGSGPRVGPPPGIVMVGSSWVTGQPSLADSPQFAAIESRAVSLADQRWGSRQALIAEIAAAKREAALRRREALLRKYAEERARQLALYRAELTKIEAERAAAQAKLAAERRKYQQELAAWLRARTVNPGQECQDPVVRRYYNCSSGLLPAH